MIVALLCGCSDLVCGEGTHEEQGVCLPNILYTCGEGTYYENGYCIVDYDALGADASAADVPDEDRDTGG